MTITIHRLGVADVKRAENLARRLDFTKDFNYLEKCLQVKDEEKIVLLAAVDGVDCGLCVVNFTPIYPLFRRLEIPEIQDLNVHPDARRAGVGTALIGAAENLARTRGAAQIGIGVGLSPPYGAAQRLYIQLGYVPDGAGVGTDDTPVRHGDFRAIDDHLCLWMVKGVRDFY